MAQENIFDAFQYFRHLGETNKLAASEGFKVGFCAGINGLEDLVANYQTADKMILIDDTTDERTFSNGSGYFRTDVYTIFIVAAYRIDDMKDREAKLSLCRRLFRQFHSRLMHDQESMEYGDALEYLRLDNIRSAELGNYFMQGVTGLHFMISNEEPVDIEYNADEWTE